MSDAVVISLIGAVGSFLAATLSLANNFLARRNEVNIRDTKQKMVTLERNTNSMKDALVKVTGESEFAKGKMEGRTEAHETMRQSNLPPVINE